MICTHVHGDIMAYETVRQELRNYISGELEVKTMKTKELLDKAMELKPEERFTLVESLIQSLDEPDKKLDEIWAEEAENRLRAYREGKLEGVPIEEIFKEE